MKRLLILFAALPLAGCASLKLGAKPHDIACPQALLTKYSSNYGGIPLFEDIQRDAGSDFEPAASAATVRTQSAEQEPEDLIYAALARPLTRPVINGENNKPTRMLLLSGGGGWGAFGAGFLKALNDMKDTRPDRTLPKFDVVTGVSTGAIQSLMIAADEYETLVKEYTAPEPLAKHAGLSGVLFKGYLNDTQPLRERLEELMCLKPGSCKSPENATAYRIAHANIALLMGYVEASTGQFKLVDIGLMLKDAYDPRKGGGPAAVATASRCTVAVTLASAAVPVQLRAVRIDDGSGRRTYTDGGVRLSVFEAALGKAAQRFQTRTNREVELYVIRNGPTVVKPSAIEPGTRESKVDRHPSADQVGMMSYATLVNQNELMSIASLRLAHPTGKIWVATADGYGTSKEKLPWRKSESCRKTSDEVFDNKFMQCLSAWGDDKARHHPDPWIKLISLDEALKANALDADGK